MKARNRLGLDDESRKLLGKMVQNRFDAGPSAAKRQTPQGPATGLQPDIMAFENLPGYRELKIQRSMASLVGLENPYFKLHETAAGATTVIGGRLFSNYSSYDYLGLNHHPSVRSAARSAIDIFGTSASASRLVAGERPGHRALEQALAQHYGQEDCIAFVSGHATNVSTIGAILGPKDLIVHESLAHNSILAGAILSRAERRSFPHNDLDALDILLATLRHQFERALIVVEGLYSMDGDIPDLPGLIEIKRRHNAWLMVDDAHGLGVLGPRGYGLFDHYGTDPRGVDIWMGTLSKTLASCGGFIAGPTALIEYLKCLSGGFVYSVGLSPPLSAAASAALSALHQEPERVRRLQAASRMFFDSAKARGWDTGMSIGVAIIPIMTGNSLRAVALSQRLFERGINVQPIIYPAVPERAARLRFFVTSEHRPEQIEETIEAIAKSMEDVDTNPALRSIPGFAQDELA